MTRLATISILVIFAVSTLTFAQATNHPEGQHKESGTKNPGRQHSQSKHAGDWLRKYKEMPQQEQEKVLNNDPEFQKLPAERQRRLRQKLQEFNNLPPQQKEKIVQRMQAFDRLTPEQRQQARELHAKLQSIPPDRRKKMHLALRNLRRMNPQERDQVLNSDEFRSTFNDNEREVMRGLSELPIGPATRQPGAPKPNGPAQ